MRASWLNLGVLCVALTLVAACDPAATPAPPLTPDAPSASLGEPESIAPRLPEADADAVSAPNSAFIAIDPSEVGVQGAASLDEALAPLLAGAHEESGDLQVSTRETDDSAMADIVRSGLEDDSVSAAHIRIEFRREAEGWFPINAYRRMQCARGPNAGQWSAAPCP